MSKPNANPFFETDFTKMMGDFKMPAFNFEALMAAQRRNIEVFTAVNQAAFESMQGLARRQAEMVRQGVEEATSLVNAVMQSPTAEEKVMRHAEASKAAVEKCLSSARDIQETLGKVNNQAIETVTTRLSESLEELRGIITASKAAA